jgi:phosphonate transport system substrate-binding protein
MQPVLGGGGCPVSRKGEVSRRDLLAGMAGIICAACGRSIAGEAPFRFALTPVLITSDLVMLEELKAFLARAMHRPVHLVSRRTYQEITTLLVSRQVDAAWICGYPFVAHRNDVALVAVPVWNRRPLYQSYLIARFDQKAESLPELAGTVHAFSDPDSNSGYLVTCAALAEMGTTPGQFFRQFFYTYGHRNVVRAVAAGLAATGSVDGYVYEVLRDTEPDLVARTKVIRRSEWLGFPPIACPASEAHAPATAQLRDALVSMATDEHGKAVLAMLRLDGFRVEQPELFDGVAAKMKLVRGTGE